jgi:hypothetical protein
MNDQILRKSLAGSMIIDPIKSSAPPTAIPTIRNGSNINQTIGYKISASNANGQHKTNKMHHSKNLIIAPPLFIAD